MDEDDGTPSDMDDSHSHDMGDEWKNWRADDANWESEESAQEEVKKKRKKHLNHIGKGIGMPVELADGWWVMQKVRAGKAAGAWAEARDRMMWVIDERPSTDVGLDVTWWDWLKELGLWDPAAASDARS